MANHLVIECTIKNQYYSEPVGAKELNSPLRLVHHHHHYKPASNHPWNRATRMGYELKQLNQQGLIPRKQKIVPPNIRAPIFSGKFGTIIKEKDKRRCVDGPSGRVDKLDE